MKKDVINKLKINGKQYEDVKVMMEVMNGCFHKMLNV